MFDSIIDLWNKWFGNGSGPVKPERPYSSHQNHTHLPYTIERGKVDWGLPGEINGNGNIDFNGMDIQPLFAKPTLVDLTDPYKLDAARAKKLDKQVIINGVIAIEAGYVNHPSDKGGPTNLGITQAVAAENKKLLTEKFKWSGDMRDITHDMAFAIYEVNYWNKLRLDDIVKINALLADKLFDIAVNCGTNRAGIWLKTLLNVLNRQGKDYADIDAKTGYIGDVTIQTLKTLIAKRGLNPTMKTLLTGLVAKQGSHYIEICIANPKNEDFAWGWMNNRMHHHLAMYFEMLK